MVTLDTLELCPRCEADVTGLRVRCAECGQVLDYDLTYEQRPTRPTRPPLTDAEIERRFAGERFSA